MTPTDFFDARPGGPIRAAVAHHRRDEGTEPGRRPAGHVPGLQSADGGDLPDRPPDLAQPPRPARPRRPRHTVQPVDPRGQPVGRRGPAAGPRPRAVQRPGPRRPAADHRRLGGPGRRPGRPIPGRPAVAHGDPAVRRRGGGQHGRPHPRGAGRLPARAVPRAGVDEQPVRPGHAHRTAVAEAQGRPRAGPAGDAAGRQAPAEPAADRTAEGVHPRPGRLLADDGRGRRRLLQRSPAAPRPGRAAAGRRLRARGRRRDGRRRRPFAGDHLHGPAHPARPPAGLRERPPDPHVHPVGRDVRHGRLRGVRPGPGDPDLGQRRPPAAAAGAGRRPPDRAAGRRAVRPAGHRGRDGLPGGGGEPGPGRPRCSCTPTA